MRKVRNQVIAALCTALLVPAVALSAIAAETGEQITPVLASLVAPPSPAVLSDGRYYLLYELMLTSATNVAIELESLEVLDPQKKNRPVAFLDSAYIKSHSRFPGAKGPAAMLGPAQSGYLKVNLSFDTLEEVPKTISHMLRVSTAEPWGLYETTTIMEQQVAQVTIPRDTGPVIAPPLKGERWIAVAVAGNSYHRNTVMPLNGKWVAPERWAVDWIKIDANNLLCNGDSLKCESYPQYGQEILAVADGTVLEARNDQPDQIPGRLPEDIPFEDACGNFVLLNIGEGYSAFFAHFIPGTVRVRAGDEVIQGQVLGLLGNSGNSDAPHLHFHIVKGSSCLASNGVPYVIDSFKLEAYAVSSDNLEPELESGEVVQLLPVGDSGYRAHVMPANLDMVHFAEK